MNKYHDIALALAGICQPALLVNQLAMTSYCDNTLFHQSIAPIFVTDPTTTESVYGDRANVKFGLTSLINLFNSDITNHAEILRYVFNLLALSKTLAKSPDALNALSIQLDRLQPIYENERDNLSEMMITRLATIYSEIISPLGQKIRVPGKVEILQNPYIQSKIRALLLSGIRSGVLWQQVGGTRLNLIFGRKKLISAAQSLL